MNRNPLLPVILESFVLLLNSAVEALRCRKVAHFEPTGKEMSGNMTWLQVSVPIIPFNKRHSFFSSPFLVRRKHQGLRALISCSLKLRCVFAFNMYQGSSKENGGIIGTIGRGSEKTIDLEEAAESTSAEEALICQDSDGN